MAEPLGSHASSKSTRSKARQWWRWGIVIVALLPIVYFVVKPPCRNCVDDRWMLLPEPLGPSLAIGHMWDGTVLTSGCYSTQYAVDSLGGADRERREFNARGKVGLKLIEAVGLEELVGRVEEWSLQGWGARVATAVNPAPVLREGCTPQRDGLPRYPMISALLGYDSVMIITSASANLRAKVTPKDTAVLRNAGISMTTSDSAIVLRRGRSLWFGFRALGLTREPDSSCTREVEIGEELSCGSFPYVATVKQRFANAYYRMESLNRDSPHPVVRSDTVAPGGYVTLGVTQAASGSLGDWYSMRVAPSVEPQRAMISMRRLRYRIDRFERESDRARWKRFIAR